MNFQLFAWQKCQVIWTNCCNGMPAHHVKSCLAKEYQYHLKTLRVVYRQNVVSSTCQTAQPKEFENFLVQAKSG